MLISSKNTFIETFRIMFDQISVYCGLLKLIHKINHHGTFLQWIIILQIPKMCHVYTQSQSYRLLYTGLPPSSSLDTLVLSGEGGCLWFTWMNHCFEIILSPRRFYYCLWIRLWGGLKLSCSPEHFQYWIHIVWSAQEETDLYCAIYMCHLYIYVCMKVVDVTVLIEKSSHFIFYMCLSFLNTIQIEVYGWLGLKTNMSDEHHAVLRISSLG